MRYQVTMGGEFLAEFIDSGDAHRYAKRESKRQSFVIRVRRVQIIKPALTSGDEGVYYSDGKVQ